MIIFLGEEAEFHKPCILEIYHGSIYILVLLKKQSTFHI